MIGSLLIILETLLTYQIEERMNAHFEQKDSRSFTSLIIFFAI